MKNTHNEDNGLLDRWPFDGSEPDPCPWYRPSWRPNSNHEQPQYGCSECNAEFYEIEEWQEHHQEEHFDG